jgi:hypothetical protein
MTNLGSITITATVANDSHTHDTRYYTESEADSRFVNASGDTITGTLTYNDVSRYWLSAATNYGIYWDTTNHELEFHGAGVDKFHVDLDNGNTWIGGTLSVSGAITGSLSGNAST